MTFLVIVMKNLWRRPVRTLLTVTGIAIGIAAVVALTGMAGNFQRNWEEAYEARGTDLIVTKTTSGSPLPTGFSEDLIEEVAELPHVEEVAGLLTDLLSVEDAPLVLVTSWSWDSFLWRHLKLVKGRWPANEGEPVVLLGRMMADALGKSVGDLIQIEVMDFTVCGIIESVSIVENNAVIMALPQFQEASDNRDRINFLNLQLSPGTTEEQIKSLQEAIRARYPGFRASTGADVARNNTGMQLTRAMSWGTSVLALVIGAVGVMNTVLMSVFERVGEIGILLAIGWRRSRILRMILYESMTLSIIGGILGVGFGVLALKLLELLPIMRGRLEGAISPEAFLLAMAIALVLGILSGIFPAYHSSRMNPSLAIRHE